MFYKIKIIRKGTKPPIWRRAYVPSNITFAQMAVILEKLVGFPKSVWYEYEFYMAKDRFVEWQDGDDKLADSCFSYWNAPDNYVNEWFEHNSAFTFQLRKNQEDYPAYRVEIEETISRILIDKEGTDELNSPCLITDKRPANDKYWNDGNEMNALLKKEFFLHESEQMYWTSSEVWKHLEEMQGIGVCQEMTNREIHSRKSPRRWMKEIGDLIAHSEELLRKSETFMERMSEMTEEQIQHEGSEQENQELIEKANETMKKAEASIKAAAAKMQVNSVQMRTAKKSTSITEILNTYTREELREIADDLECRLAGNTKQKIVYELARYLLTAENMRKFLYEVEEPVLDLFEKLLDRGRYEPTEKQLSLLYEMIDRYYMIHYKDDEVLIPDDVKIAYEVLLRSGYREVHAKISWFRKCISVYSKLHILAPSEVLYQMFCLKYPITKDEFEKLFYMVPSYINFCIWNDDLIFTESCRDETYRKAVESNQREVECYIPTVEEIQVIYEKEYPANEKAYKNLKEFFLREMHIAEEESERFCRMAYRIFMTQGRLSDYMKMLNQEEVTFESEKQVRKFADLIVNVNNHTRSYVLRGHKPIEMKTEKKITEKKVYPNDPCPCGSGKKYKKCCGRR